MSDYIPIDLVIRILEHLPAESLLRFRRVCQWMNRFIDRAFIQHRLAIQKPRFIAVHGGREVQVLNPHTPSMTAALLARRSGSEPANLVGTLHGIVCFYYYKSHFLVCNPLIRKSLLIPLPDFTKSLFTDYASGYDYSYDDIDEVDNEVIDASCVFSGFYIDPGTVDFKIIIFRLFDPHVENISDIILYSSVTQDWQAIYPWKVTMYPSLSETPAVVIGKVGYWRVFGDTSSTEIGYGEVRIPCIGAAIVTFDFVTKDFDIFKGPHPDYKLRYLPVLSRWRETLSLVFVDKQNHCEVYFWEAEEIWFKNITFDLTSVSGITRVLSMVEYETDSAEELLENRRVPAATNSTKLVLCDSGPAFFLQAEIQDVSTLSVAYDYVGSLLFPQE